MNCIKCDHPESDHLEMKLPQSIALQRGDVVVFHCFHMEKADPVKDPMAALISCGCEHPPFA